MRSHREGWSSVNVAYDVPQIYTAHNAKTEDEYIRLLEESKRFRSLIGGMYLWGKSISSMGRKVSHCGDLNSYFGDQAIKEHFLQAFKECFDDGNLEWRNCCVIWLPSVVGACEENSYFIRKGEGK